MANYPPQSRRDLGVTALVEGFFATAWFGWGSATASGLAWWTTVGTILALLVAASGAIIGFRSPRSTAKLRDPAAGRRYGIIIGIEFGSAAIGAAILGGSGQGAYIPAWVCVVVGVHFFALAPVLGDPRLVLLGVLTCLVAFSAAAIPLITDVAPSLIAGLGAGTLLLVFGAIALVGAVRKNKMEEIPLHR